MLRRVQVDLRSESVARPSVAVRRAMFGVCFSGMIAPERATIAGAVSRSQQARRRFGELLGSGPCQASAPCGAAHHARHPERERVHEGRVLAARLRAVTDGDLGAAHIDASRQQASTVSSRSSRLARASLAMLLLLSGCFAPTLSKPRGQKHLDALAEASQHQHHGRLREAADAYVRAAEAAERRVDRDESLYRQSRALARLGAFREAIAVCDQLGASETIARRTLRARLDAARYRLVVGEADRAEHDLHALIVAEPEGAAARGALRMLARMHVDGASDKRESLSWVRALRSEIEQSSLAEALMSLEAALLVELGEKDEAKLVLEQQIERYPYPRGSRWDDALWQLADLSLAQRAPSAAVAYLKRMIAVHESSIIIGSYTRPLFSRAALRIARIYRDELRDPQAAIDAYAAMRREFPRSLVIDDALAEQAELHLARGERTRGCKLLRELLYTHEVGSARRHAEARIAAACQ